MINANTKMYCTECEKKLHPTQKFCTCSEPTKIAAASCMTKAERKTQDIKEISDNDKISIISPSKYKLNTSSSPVNQSEAHQAVFDSHGKQKIKNRGKIMTKPLSTYSINLLSIKPLLKLEK